MHVYMYIYILHTHTQIILQFYSKKPDTNELLSSLILEQKNNGFKAAIFPLLSGHRDANLFQYTL